MASPTEKNTRLHSWPDYALFVAALVFCAFSVKAFSRFSLHSQVQAPVKELHLPRGLASVASEGVVVERSTRTMELSCLDENTHRTQTEASLLRLTAPGCGGRILRATNLTTGEPLLLFERNDIVSTHYFPLKAGLNKILVEWKSAKKGAKTLEVEKTF